MIRSILDNDLYNFTQHWAVHQCYPNIPVEYLFTNRDTSMKFGVRAYDELRKRIDRLSELKLTSDEEDFLRDKCPFFPDVYIGYLRQFKYHPECVQTHLDDDFNLHLKIVGDWDHTILFEVPLLALISEVYFEYCDPNWSNHGQSDLARDKALKLCSKNLSWADFGTRRRRSYLTQMTVVNEMSKLAGFVGTSNVHFAHIFGTKPIGTMAHQWIMGTSAMCGLRHANRYALQNWTDVYGADLGVALTDTFGTDAFFEDFDMRLAKVFDGVRHDSGDPIIFADKVIEHYRKLRIDSTTKTIVFSDGLDVDKAIRVAEHCKGKIRCSFGIGTHFTNDFKDNNGNKSKPMNIVIKLRKCNGTEVVKISDEPGKATGDEDATRVAMWTFFNKPLSQMNEKL